MDRLELRVYYNLDMIISGGYRGNSKRGTQFHRWAARRLRDYLAADSAINEERRAGKAPKPRDLKRVVGILNWKCAP